MPNDLCVPTAVSVLSRVWYRGLSFDCSVTVAKVPSVRWTVKLSGGAGETLPHRHRVHWNGFVLMASYTREVELAAERHELVSRKGRRYFGDRIE
jgi:hypothetical protein